MCIPQIGHAELRKVSRDGVDKKLPVLERHRQLAEVGANEANRFDVIIEPPITAVTATFVRLAIYGVALCALPHGVRGVEGAESPVRVGKGLMLNTRPHQGFGTEVM